MAFCHEDFLERKEKKEWGDSELESKLTCEVLLYGKEHYIQPRNHFALPENGTCAWFHFQCTDTPPAYLLVAVNNRECDLYVNTVSVIDATALLFGIFITFSLQHWNIITNEKMGRFFHFFFFFLKMNFKKTKIREKKLVCSQVQWHPRAHDFSLLTTFVLRAFAAHVRQSACSSSSEPRATISVYSCGKAPAFPINSLDRNIVKSRLFFSELMNLFQEAGSYSSHLSLMWWGAGGSASSLVLEGPLQRWRWGPLRWLEAQGAYSAPSE